MRISQRGLDLIKRFEGLRLRSYLCPAGVWTIGYGSTGPHVHRNMVITESEAEQLLQRDLVRFENGVLSALSPSVPLQEEFDAMVSLAFNIGIGAFARSSVCRLYKAGRIAESANAFSMWTKARVNGRLTVLPGLVTRRSAEKALFLSARGEPTVSRQTGSNRTVSVPEASVVPEAPKPLSTSREIIGGGVVGAGGITSFVSSVSVDQASQIRTEVMEIQNVPENSLAHRFHIPEIASALVLIIGLFIIWKRISDRRNGIR